MQCSAYNLCVDDSIFHIYRHLQVRDVLRHPWVQSSQEPVHGMKYGDKKVDEGASYRGVFYDDLLMKVPFELPNDAVVVCRQPAQR